MNEQITINNILQILEDCSVDLINEEVSRAIAEEIDASITLESLSREGWYLVTLETLGPQKRANKIKQWISNNVSGRFYQYGRRFAFEDSKDATLFTVLWS